MSSDNTKAIVQRCAFNVVRLGTCLECLDSLFHGDLQQPEIDTLDTVRGDVVLMQEYFREIGRRAYAADPNVAQEDPAVALAVEVAGVTLEKTTLSDAPGAPRSDDPPEAMPGHGGNREDQP